MPTEEDQIEEARTTHDLMPTLEVDDDDEPIVRCSRCGLTLEEAAGKSCEVEGM